MLYAWSKRFFNGTLGSDDTVNDGSEWIEVWLYERCLGNWYMSDGASNGLKREKFTS